MFDAALSFFIFCPGLHGLSMFSVGGNSQIFAEFIIIQPLLFSMASQCLLVLALYMHGEGPHTWGFIKSLKSVLGI